MKNSHQFTGLIAVGALVALGLSVGLATAQAQVPAALQAQALPAAAGANTFVCPPAQATTAAHGPGRCAGDGDAAQKTVGIVKSASNIKNMSIAPDVTGRNGPVQAPNASKAAAQKGISGV